ncbi:MAG: COQ9 family protein [Alphaproteobacteria bacterium]|nr:COQ9 family protein [Alphaproteobacteria bacterium]MBV9371782.1 COQ9 family protein [Alphaproteobacteria bacterium]MBV9901933.1 COQ9 family protein [Alphaproteobacteria bacterium]
MADLAPPEMTLDELRLALAPRIAPNAVFDGWSDKALAMAAAELGVPAPRARLCFPRGAVEMIDAWFDSIDRAAALAFPLERIEAMKIRERIRALVMFRIERVHPDKEALRRAIAILAQPQNVPLAARLAWRAADRMWRIAGDRATDFNHYSKRAILMGVYGSTQLVYLDDEGEGLAATRAFLERRIDDVMRFEKVKAQWRGNRERLPSLSRFLGRLRYPAV